MRQQFYQNNYQSQNQNQNQNRFERNLFDDQNQDDYNQNPNRNQNRFERNLFDDQNQDNFNQNRNRNQNGFNQNRFDDQNQNQGQNNDRNQNRFNQNLFDDNQDDSKQNQNRTQSRYNDQNQDDFNQNQNQNQNRNNQNRFNQNLFDDNREDYNQNQNRNRNQNRFNQNLFDDQNQGDYDQNQNQNRNQNRANQNLFDNRNQDDYDQNQNQNRNQNRFNQNLFDNRNQDDYDQNQNRNQNRYNQDDYNQNQNRNQNRYNNNQDQYDNQNRYNNNQNQYDNQNRYNQNNYQNQNQYNRNNNNMNYMNNQGSNNSNQRKGKLEYLTSTLTAAIVEYTEKQIDNSPVIFYRIKITDHFNNHSWMIEKRYNDFVNLQKKLVVNFPDVPKIPGKTFFRISDFASIKKRKDGLQYFLKTCINRKDIFASEDFKTFLELAQNSPDLCGNSPDMEGNFTLSQGVRDFCYIPQENIIVLCTAEMNIIERAESKITDLKNKIEKQDEITNPQGFAYVYRVEENNGDFIFRETWRRKFKGRTRCITYDPSERYLIIGRTDGFISIHSLDKDSRYKKVDLVIELKNHLSTVNGIWFDPLEKKVYSVSSDKRFVASEISYNSQITEINKSSFEYTCLKPDLKYDRLFTASEGGIIDIYSIKKFPPKKICSTSITGLGNIKDIYININQFYIFACDFKGKISVLDFGSINSPNNSGNNLCSEISQFGGKNPLRNIVYDENKKELITGDEAGKIVVWSIKTGQPIFSWNAHENGGAVTRLYYDPNSRLLVSGGKDKNIKFWKLPDNWVNSDVLRFETEELKKINNEIARRRIKAQQEIEDGIENDFDSDLSQEDDLNGWNYRKDK